MTPTQEWTLPGDPAAGLIADPLPDVHRCSMGECAGICKRVSKVSKGVKNQSVPTVGRVKTTNSSKRSERLLE